VNERSFRASFESYWSGGMGASYATWMRGGEGWFYAASTGIDLEAGAARIGLAPDQEHCSSNVFGIWVLVTDPDKAALADTTWEMAFGPAGGALTPLVLERTSLKRNVDQQGVWWGGDPFWWQSVGVPVYGSLAPGVYGLHVVMDGPFGHAVFDPTVTILSC
jgi:hypothetical protein